jgi:putative oxidoreductase
MKKVFLLEGRMMGTVPLPAEKKVDAGEHATTAERILTLYARVVIAAGFLSAVADRFGLWGPAGSSKVAWGNWKNFVAYTAVLNFFLPRWSAPILAVVVTMAETILGVLLILGLWQRATAALSAALLCLFALAMSVALGVKAPLDYSVFSAAAAAGLLYVCAGQREN